MKTHANVEPRQKIQPKTTMKALVYRGLGKPSWEDAPRPQLTASTDAIVRMTTTSICGTDLHILKGDMPEVKQGRILGHEGVGVIVEKGEGVSAFNVGDKVLISCVTSCAYCSFCRKGMYSHCQKGGWILGYMIDGTQAEYVRIPFADGSLYKMPAGFDEAALTMVSDILPTGYEAGVLNGRIEPGSSVAIIGAGPVGLAALLTAQFYSPAMIIMIDPDKNRVQAARALGATHGLSAGDASVGPSVMGLTGGLGVDVAIEAVGAVPTFLLCQEIVAAGGTIANIGVHGKSVELHLEKLWSRNIRITTRLVDTAAIPMLLKAVESKRLKPELLITHRFGFDEMPKAYETFANAAREKAVKVAISTEKPFNALKAPALDASMAGKADGKESPVGESAALYRNGNKSGDEDNTGGDDADDRTLPNIRNDKNDATARKRDTEERFSVEQKREDDKKREENSRR